MKRCLKLVFQVDIERNKETKIVLYSEYGELPIGVMDDLKREVYQVIVKHKSLLIGEPNER